MLPKASSLKSEKEMLEIGRKARSAAKDFGKVKADKYAKEAKSRMGEYVSRRKGL